MAEKLKKWIKYISKSTKEQLQRNLGIYLAANQKFRGFIKIGKSSLENLSSRDGNTDR